MPADEARLIAIGVAMVHPFLTAASLDLTAKICVVAFSLAIPLLAALVLVNRQEAGGRPWRCADERGRSARIRPIPGWRHTSRPTGRSSVVLCTVASKRSTCSPLV
jgi:hypothetical protein